MKLSRRDFLKAAAASTVLAALPIPLAPNPKRPAVDGMKLKFQSGNIGQGTFHLISKVQVDSHVDTVDFSGIEPGHDYLIQVAEESGDAMEAHLLDGGASGWQVSSRDYTPKPLQKIKPSGPAVITLYQRTK